jgi:hypothetical protein
VLAQMVGGEYFAFIDIDVVAPQSPPTWPVVVGNHRVLGQDLAWPAYWKTERFGAALHLLHADAQHPCNISNVGGLKFIDESCLTSAGRALRDVALANAAQDAIKAPPTAYVTFMVGKITNCFGQTSNVTLARSSVFINPSGANELAASGSIWLPLGTDSFPLILLGESHDARTWNQLSQSRLAALVPLGNSAAGPNPCSPHIP